MKQMKDFESLSMNAVLSPFEDIKNGLKYLAKSMSLMMKRCLISRALLLITSIHFGSKDVFLPGLGTLMKGLRIIQTMHR